MNIKISNKFPSNNKRYSSAEAATIEKKRVFVNKNENNRKSSSSSIKERSQQIQGKILQQRKRTFSSQNSNYTQLISLNLTHPTTSDSISSTSTTIKAKNLQISTISTKQCLRPSKHFTTIQVLFSLLSIIISSSSCWASVSAKGENLVSFSYDPFFPSPSPDNAKIQFRLFQDEKSPEEDETEEPLVVHHHTIRSAGDFHTQSSFPFPNFDDPEWEPSCEELRQMWKYAKDLQNGAAGNIQTTTSTLVGDKEGDDEEDKNKEVMPEDVGSVDEEIGLRASRRRMAHPPEIRRTRTRPPAPEIQAEPEYGIVKDPTDSDGRPPPQLRVRDPAKEIYGFMRKNQPPQSQASTHESPRPPLVVYGNVRTHQQRPKSRDPSSYLDLVERELYGERPTSNGKHFGQIRYFQESTRPEETSFDKVRDFVSGQRSNGLEEEDAFEDVRQRLNEEGPRTLPLKSLLNSLGNHHRSSAHNRGGGRRRNVRDIGPLERSFVLPPTSASAYSLMPSPLTQTSRQFESEDSAPPQLEEEDEVEILTRPPPSQQQFYVYPPKQKPRRKLYRNASLLKPSNFRTFSRRPSAEEVAVLEAVEAEIAQRSERQRTEKQLRQEYLRRRRKFRRQRKLYRLKQRKLMKELKRRQKLREKAAEAEKQQEEEEKHQEDKDQITQQP